MSLWDHEVGEFVLEWIGLGLMAVRKAMREAMGRGYCDLGWLIERE